MKIIFRTKDESNKSQRERFLKLSPAERVRAFLKYVYVFNTSKISAKPVK